MLVHQDTDIDTTLLSHTNRLWNDLRLNHPWSVGFTSELIRHYPFKNYAEWRHHYLESGVIRDLRLQELEPTIIDQLNNHLWYHDADQDDKEALSSILINLNFHRGRSPSSIYQKATFFATQLKRIQINIDVASAAKLIGHRVLVETWNGHVRETNTIVRLEQQFPHLIIEPTDGWADFQYAIDFTIHNDDGLVGAIQVKPESYHGEADYIQIAKAVNRQKNKKYSSEYNVPVWTVLSTITGEIVTDDNLIPSLYKLEETL